MRLSQDLEAQSVFTGSGTLSSEAISGSRVIIPGGALGNQGLVQRLSAIGGDINDWAKYSTGTYRSPSGDFQVHFYMNKSSGFVDYWSDYKVKFNKGP